MEDQTERIRVAYCAMLDSSTPGAARDFLNSVQEYRRAGLPAAALLALSAELINLGKEAVLSEDVVRDPEKFRSHLEHIQRYSDKVSKPSADKRDLYASACSSLIDNLLRVASCRVPVDRVTVVQPGLRIVASLTAAGFGIASDTPLPFTELDLIELYLEPGNLDPKDEVSFMAVLLGNPSVLARAKPHQVWRIKQRLKALGILEEHEHLFT